MAKGKASSQDKINKAISLMVAGNNITDAAKQAGISRATLSNHINNSTEAQELLNAQRAEVLQNTAETTKRVFNKALAVVEEALDNKDIDFTIKLQSSLAFIGKIATVLSRQAEAEQKAEDNSTLPPKIIVEFTDKPEDYKDDPSAVVCLPDNGRGNIPNGAKSM